MKYMACSICVPMLLLIPYEWQCIPVDFLCMGKRFLDSRNIDCCHGDLAEKKGRPWVVRRLCGKVPVVSCGDDHLFMLGKATVRGDPSNFDIVVQVVLGP